jgi:hypothetical protein
MFEREIQFTKDSPLCKVERLIKQGMFYIVSSTKNNCASNKNRFQIFLSAVPQST